MKHTPGPWITGDDAIGIVPRGDYVVGFPGVKPGARTMSERCEQHIANGRLIAAAPDLLAACEMAFNAFTKNWAIDWNILEDAIKKAKGVTPDE